MAAWEGEGAIQALRNRFVTGDWEEGQRRAAAAPGSDDEDGEAGEVGEGSSVQALWEL